MFLLTAHVMPVLMSIGTDSPVPPPVATLTMTLLWNWCTDIKTWLEANPSFWPTGPQKPLE